MSKVFVHLGAHKTATSFIQANLVANRPVFEKQGWRVVYIRKDGPKVYRYIKDLRRGNKLEPDQKKTVKSFFTDVREDQRNVFLSCEIILGAMSIKNAQGLIYPRSESMIDWLRKQLDGRDVSIGFCVRNFADYIESSYAYLVGGYGATYDFANYTKNLSVENISWVRLFEQLSAVFGPEKLKIWTYEDFKKNNVAGLKAIIRAAGVDPEEIKVAVSDPVNVSAPVDSLPVAIAWNRLVESRPSLKIAEKEKLWSQMQALLAKVGRVEHAQSLLPPDLREALNQSYQREIEIIKSRWPHAMISFTGQASDGDRQQYVDAHA
jgi:hypothetical protein